MPSETAQRPYERGPFIRRLLALIIFGIDLYIYDYDYVIFYQSIDNNDQYVFYQQFKQPIILQTVMSYSNHPSAHQQLHQAHSQNNLLNQHQHLHLHSNQNQNQNQHLHYNQHQKQKESYDFNDSLIITPIQMYAGQIPQHSKGRNLNTGGEKRYGGSSMLGHFQKYGLGGLLAGGLAQEDNGINIGTYGKEARSQLRNKGQLVTLVSIDPQSNILTLSDTFTQLMTRHSSSPVSFLAVLGQKQVGKSFFCDKVLNLAQIRGCHYGQKVGEPGIYLYSVPFVKDGMEIFLMEIGGCELGSQSFQRLIAVAMVLGADYIFIEGLGQREQREKQYHRFYSSFAESCQRIKSPNPPNPNSNLYHLHRTPNFTPYHQTPKLNSVTKFIHTFHLPDAMSPSYTGNKKDLQTCSFLVRECVNPAYVQTLSEIFKEVYKNADERTEEDLLRTGCVVGKLVQYVVPVINNERDIILEGIYERIVKELYISAYNFCILGYHDQLEEYFGDEEPKNTTQMYRVFEKATDNILEKFGEFRLRKSLHQEYQKKIMEHVEKKERDLCEINREKTREFLSQEFRKYSDGRETDIAKIFSGLKNFRPELDDGRQQAYKQILIDMFKSTQGQNPALVKKLHALTEQKQKLQHKLAQVSRRYEQDRKNYQQLQRNEQQIDKEIKKINTEIASLSAIDAEGINKLKNQISGLKQKKVTTQEKLREYRGQNNDGTLEQVRQNYQQKINTTIAKQKQIQKQLEEIKKNAVKQNPELKTPSKIKLPAAEISPSKIKTSQIKKQGKQAVKDPIKKSELKQPKPKPK